MLRIAALQTDERTVLELLQRGAWVQPGYFFGMPDSGWLVVSLLGSPGEFREGIRIFFDYLSRLRICPAK